MEPRQQKFSIGYVVVAMVALMLLQSVVFRPHTPSSPRRWPARRACRSSASPGRTSWRCSSGFATSSSRRRRRRRASSSSTSWTRFDRQIVVDRPDLKGREKILQVHARGARIAPHVDLGLIAARTPGFAGADLANLVNEAALGAARRGKDAVELEDFDAAIDRIVAGLERKSRVISPREKEIVAHHEAGHALVAESRRHADRVAKISIIPRGVAALGYTQQQPTEDRYLMTRAELLDRLDVLLGGRVAEELVLGDVSTGAQDDLQRATDLVRHMITRYGMSRTLGLAALEAPRTALFLPVPGGGAREYSERTAAAIDDEVQALLQAAHDRARETLVTRRGALDALAKLLIDREVLDGESVRQTIASAHSGAAGGGSTT